MLCRRTVTFLRGRFAFAHCEASAHHTRKRPGWQSWAACLTSVVKETERERMLRLSLLIKTRMLFLCLVYFIDKYRSRGPRDLTRGEERGLMVYLNPDAHIPN